MLHARMYQCMIIFYIELICGYSCQSAVQLIRVRLVEMGRTVKWVIVKLWLSQSAKEVNKATSTNRESWWSKLPHHLVPHQTERRP